MEWFRLPGKYSGGRPLLLRRLRYSPRGLPPEYLPPFQLWFEDR
jgi:hypothetical protein